MLIKTQENATSLLFEIQKNELGKITLDNDMVGEKVSFSVDPVPPALSHFYCFDCLAFEFYTKYSGSNAVHPWQ